MLLHVGEVHMFEASSTAQWSPKNIGFYSNITDAHGTNYHFYFDANANSFCQQGYLHWWHH